MKLTKKHKRILTACIALVMIFSLAACSNSEDVEEEVNPEEKYAHVVDENGVIHYLYRDNENPYPFEIIYMYKLNSPLPYMIKNGDTVITYGYNDDNYRISKDINGITTTFEYEKSFYHDTYQLAREVRDGEEINYLYQTYGELFDDIEATEAEAGDIVYDRDHIKGFTYRGETYGYVKGDDAYITGITDESGEEIVKYEYDGSVITAVLGLDENGEWVDMSGDENFIGNINKVRAWSEYYDDETGWYYTGGDYYADPVNGGWIKPEEKEAIMIDEEVIT